MISALVSKNFMPIKMGKNNLIEIQEITND